MTSIVDDLVDPPTFYLPSDFNTINNDPDYEVWSLRTPVAFDPSALDGVSLSFNNDILANQNQTKKKYGGGAALQQDKVISSFELSNDSNDRYSIAVGHTSETKSFRILVPTKPTAEGDDNDDDDDDDREHAKKNMKLLSIPFTRHVNLIRSSKVEMTEFETAPSKERAPKPQITATAITGESKQNIGLKMTMREAYSHIDQVKGLKRRWNMFGTNIDVDAAQERQKRRQQAYVDNQTQQQQTGTAPNKNNDVVMIDSDVGRNSDEQGATTVKESPSPKKDKRDKKKSEKKKRRKSVKKSSSAKKELKQSKKKKHRDSSKSPKKT